MQECCFFLASLKAFICRSRWIFEIFCCQVRRLSRLNSSISCFSFFLIVQLWIRPFAVTGTSDIGESANSPNKRLFTAIARLRSVLFTCTTELAIHLEIVESLLTESFFQTLRRFVSHHGWPATVISDNGKSFVGSERESLIKLVIEERKQINDFAVLHKVRWIFTTS